MLLLTYPCAGYGCWWRVREEVTEKNVLLKVSVSSVGGWGRRWCGMSLSHLNLALASVEDVLEWSSPPTVLSAEVRRVAGAMLAAGAVGGKRLQLPGSARHILPVFYFFFLPCWGQLAGSDRCRRAVRAVFSLSSFPAVRTGGAGVCWGRTGGLWSRQDAVRARLCTCQAVQVGRGPRLVGAARWGVAATKHGRPTSSPIVMSGGWGATQWHRRAMKIAGLGADKSDIGEDPARLLVE
ncbi:hypothetical protein NDU88_004279 [Pleurodeles waltl]|uniref:Uncharacterized protein n=1 Tax=Pleurodeles waltl TaxID=8319 RepID=A0AAV7VIV0_PLEWA|nr:hypothetical protein NDU88_004279 [Pleurodeles waltl]